MSSVAVFWTVDAVELSAHGDVLRVRWGLIDTRQNAWVNGRPHVAEVADVVALINSGAEVWTLLPDGTSGPLLQVVPARVDPAISTIEMMGQAPTVRDLEQLS
jgi:hypothetical protein